MTNLIQRIKDMKTSTKLVIAGAVVMGGALVAGVTYARHKADEYNKGMKELLFFYEATPQIIEKKVENTIEEMVSPDNP